MSNTIVMDDFTVEHLSAQFNRFLASVGDEAFTVSLRQFAIHILKVPYSRTHAFRQMRELVRSLPYDDSLNSIDRRIIVDEQGRGWSVAVECRWPRLWYIICSPWGDDPVHGGIKGLMRRLVSWFLR